MSSVTEEGTTPPVEPAWVQETMDRYINPKVFSKGGEPAQQPELVEEKDLSDGSKTMKFQVYLLKERPFWSKVTVHWVFQPKDVEGDDSTKTIISLIFDTWTGELNILENGVEKATDLQRPIVGGSWKAKSPIGLLEIKIETFWTGYQYELWYEGDKIYSLFT